ncbi:MAG: hypothetical protein ABH821_03670 [archaeon]
MATNIFLVVFHKNNDMKWVILVLLMIVILLFSGCIQQPNPNIEQYLEEANVTDECYAELLTNELVTASMSEEQAMTVITSLYSSPALPTQYETQLHDCWKRTYIDYVLGSGDYSACDEIQFAPKRSECEAAVAEQQGDPNHCNSIRDEYFDTVLIADEPLSVRDACRMFYLDYYLEGRQWVTQDNINTLNDVCNGISQNSTRTFCLEYVRTVEREYG